MNITIASKLMELYAACPKCGCEVIGNGKGLLECDTAAGFFKRSCGCGWHVEVSAMMRESGALNRGSFRANTQLFHPFYNIRFRPHFYVQKPNMPE